MGLFGRGNSNSESNSNTNTGANDCTEIGQVIRDQHDGNRGVELVMDDNGEMVAVPTSQADDANGIKATKIAKKDYYAV